VSLGETAARTGFNRSSIGCRAVAAIIAIGVRMFAVTLVARGRRVKPRWPRLSLLSSQATDSG
jgi:hypothetical protein